MQLATGLLHNRDLPALDDPMRNLVDHYLQRVDSSNTERTPATRVAQLLPKRYCAV